MQQAKYIRQRHIIRLNATAELVYFGKMQGEASINQAKRESARLQMKEDGMLGKGSLIVR